MELDIPFFSRNIARVRINAWFELTPPLQPFERYKLLVQLNAPRPLAIPKLVILGLLPAEKNDSLQLMRSWKLFQITHTFL